MAETERGRFIWHELMTPNPAGARDFYAQVAGWGVEPPEADASRITFVVPAGRIGGCSEQSPTATPMWVPFVTVADVSETLDHATGLGARVVTEPTSLESGGRYAVFTDPQGAAIGIYSADDFSPDRDAEPGEFSWHELATTDLSAAFDFYRQLFGWENVGEHDMGSEGVYLMFGHGSKRLGGIFDKTKTGGSGDAMWLSYLRVEDLNGTIEKVKAANGSVMNGPMEVPGGDWIAQLIDPHGAAFALHTFAADMHTSVADTSEQDAAEPAEHETAAGAVTDVWSDAPAEPEKTAAKPARKKTPSSDASARKKAAKAKTTKKKAGKTAKKSGKKKAAAKKSGKKSAKKAGSKKTAKKARSKKAAKRTGKKTTQRKAAKKKTAKKPAAQKSGTKKTGKKKAGKKKVAKKPAGKKAGKKKAGRSTGAKKAGKTTGKKTGKKSGKRTSKKAGRKKAGKK